MGFMSLLLIGVFLVMGVIGVLLLLAALMLFLVNRRRSKQGQEKKRSYKIAGVLCLVFGCINVVPVLYVWLYGMVGDRVTDLTNQAKLKSMPERAVLYQERPNDEELENLDEENEVDWGILEYQDKKYLFIPCEPDSSKVKLSKPKAYLEYGTMSSDEEEKEVVEDSSTLREVVYEVENETGYDLLTVVDATSSWDSLWEGLDLSGFYCCVDQYEDFIQAGRTGAEYYLEQFQGEYDDSGQRVSATGFQLTDLGIDNAFLDSLDDGQGETLGYYPKKEYELHMIAMDGFFSDYCTTIGKYEGKWYCYSIFSFGKIKDAHLLPEAGQRYMDALK